MGKFQKYEEKLLKYVRKLSKLKFKEKLKKLVYRIGIYHSEDLNLFDKTPENLILPCHLGILFNDTSDYVLFEKIKTHLNNILESFFYDIRNLGEYSFSKEILSKGVKKEFKSQNKKKERVKVHPTNKLHQILINKRKEESLDMICLITNLPIYSSSNNNLIFLFGETHLKHRSCIVSTLTLREKFYNRKDVEDIHYQRILKELIHEIGHLILGPNHCVDDSCVMKFSNNIEEVDKKSSYFCEICNQKLNKIQQKFNF
jgi:predicted Zn-dependent protease